MKQVLSNHRGVVKSQARTPIKSHYGFKSGSTEEVANFNRELHGSLTLPKAWFSWMVCHCTHPLTTCCLLLFKQDPVARSPGTMYYHCIFLEMIVALWFAEGARSAGVIHALFFNPNNEGIPFEVIALVMTAVSSLCFINFTLYS